MEKLLRVDTQAGHNRRVLEAAGVTVQDLATSSMRANRNVDLAAFRDRARAQMVDNGPTEGLGEEMLPDRSELANEARTSIPEPGEGVQSRGIPPEALIAAENVFGTGPQAGFGQYRRDWRDSEARRQRSILAAAAQGIGIPGRALADEAEHLLHGDQENGLAHKATNNARFGFVLDQDEFDSQRRLSPRPALPSEYL